MGSRRHHRTIMGIGAIELPEELRSTLIDTPPKAPTPMADEDATGYRAWLGRVIDGKYRLDALIAEGGMGAVFEARHVERGEPVAFKVMHAELGANDAIVQRFAREVEIGRRLTHENVVAALDTGATDDGSPYLVLELVKGPTLSHAMWEEGAFEWRRAVRVGAQIAAALGAAWDEGFVHRDLKPDNVVLEPDGRGGEKVKLLDFGIAHDRSVVGVNAKLTVAGEVLGTVGYMAPEQCVGQGVDVRSDLYALGVLLWEMLAGFSLFEEDLPRSDYLLAQMRLSPTPANELAPDAPEALDGIIRGLLAHLQKDRLGDPGEVRRALLDLLGEPAEAAPPAPPPPPPEPAPPVPLPPPAAVPAAMPGAMPATAPTTAPTAAPTTAPTAAPTSGSSQKTLFLVAGVGLALFGALACVGAAALLLLR